MSRAAWTSVFAVSGLSVVKLIAQAPRGSISTWPVASAPMPAAVTPVVCRKRRRVRRVRLSSCLMVSFPFTVLLCWFLMCFARRLAPDGRRDSSESAPGAAAPPLCFRRAAGGGDIVDDPGADRRVGLAVGHDAARHEASRIGQPGIDLLLGPGEFRLRHGRRVFEALELAGLPADHAVEIGSLALLRRRREDVAGAALIGEKIAALRIVGAGGAHQCQEAGHGGPGRAPLLRSTSPPA